MCGNNAPHADVFDDVRKGVSLDLITEMANTRTGLIDVHLLAEGALSAAFDVVCRPGVSGITFPYEGVDDVEAVAGRIRAVGAQPWLAISPATQIERRRTSLCHVDGLLIMLIEPGSKQAADVAHLEKVAPTAFDRCRRWGHRSNPRPDSQRRNGIHRRRPATLRMFERTTQRGQHRELTDACARRSLRRLTGGRPILSVQARICLRRPDATLVRLRTGTVTTRGQRDRHAADGRRVRESPRWGSHGPLDRFR